MKSNWPTNELEKMAMAAVAKKNLLFESEPADRAEYGYPKNPDLRILFWAELFGCLAKFESGFRSTVTYVENFADRNGVKVVSRGLLQLSMESVKGYGFPLLSERQLHDPQINLDAAALIASRWIARDGVIAGKSGGHAWKGMARYWSPFRKDSHVAEMKKKMKGLNLWTL